MLRILTDFIFFIRENPFDQCHPCSIFYPRSNCIRVLIIIMQFSVVGKIFSFKRWLLTEI